MAPCLQQCSPLLDQSAGMLEQTHGHVPGPDHDGSTRKDGGNSEHNKRLLVVEENLDYDNEELSIEVLAEERVLGKAVLSIWPFGRIELSLTEDPSKANRKVRNPCPPGSIHVHAKFGA